MRLLSSLVRLSLVGGISLSSFPDSLSLSEELSLSGKSSDSLFEELSLSDKLSDSLSEELSLSDKLSD